MPTQPSRNGLPWPGDCRTALALAYLALPNAVFLAGWFVHWAAALGVVALVAVMLPIFNARPRTFEGTTLPQRGLVIVLLLVAAGWTALGGAGHLFFANADWVVRDAVLRDLVVEPWPVLYAEDSGGERVLRAPIAYYLPAALAGHFFGLRVAEFALLAWTTLGVWIVFLIVVDRKDPRRTVLAKLAIIVLFSGMDFLGTILSGWRPGWTSHLEWWAGLFQYSSNTTQLFWVPNHALPGWIAAALIYRRWADPLLVRVLPALLALALLWSPLTAVGILPLAAAAFLAGVASNGIRNSFVPHAWVGALVLGSLIGAFITADSDRILADWIWKFEEDLPGLVFRYLLFIIIEYLLIWRLVVSVHRPPAVLMSGLILALLPFYAFGPSNDLAMRASIPALMVLCLALADAAPRLVSGSSPARLQTVAVFVFALASITPLTEILRALAGPRWSASLERRVVDQTDGSHYLARASNPRLATLLQKRSAGEGR